MTKPESEPKALHAPQAAVTPPSVLAPERIITALEILGAEREIILLHAGQRYRLRLTSNDRLILTK